MKFYIIHPDEVQLNALGIQENDHVTILKASLQQINKDDLRSKEFGVVAPGNSFGLMDGGYDKVIVDAFGQHVEDAVKHTIAHRWFGELPVGCALSVSAIHPSEADGIFPQIIYAPTMQVPMSVDGTANVYYATLAAIREAISNGCKCLLLPLMGAGTGGMAISDVGHQMISAIEASMNPPKEITWEYAMGKHSDWHAMTHIPE